MKNTTRTNRVSTEITFLLPKVPRMVSSLCALPFTLEVLSAT